jgi:hypothetical protein
LKRIALLLLLVASAPAYAFQGGVEAVTDFPIDVGAKLWVEGPYRLRLSTSFGVLPGGYVDTINAILVSAGAYDQQTANLIHDSLKSSFVWRLHGGWRPFKTRGAYFEVGYGLVTLGGGISRPGTLSAALGIPIDASQSYSITSFLHMVDIEVGWMWIFGRGITVRTALGCALTVGAETTVTASSHAQDDLARQTASYLDKEYTSYVFAPTLSVAIGWRVLPWFQSGW